MGAYIDALMYVKDESGRKEATLILNNFLQHLDEAGVGTISEIFDGQFPHQPRGCIAQAWSVGEILRVATKYNLLTRVKEELTSDAVH
jgi:glycogen debranching enzyme